MVKILILIYSLLLVSSLTSCAYQPEGYRDQAPEKAPIHVTHIKLEVYKPDINEDEASVQYTKSYSEFSNGIL